MSGEKFIRVRKNTPCPICGKPDWCMISQDRSVALCARVQAGSFCKTRGGWCHRLTARIGGLSNFDKNQGIRRSYSSPTHAAAADQSANGSRPAPAEAASLPKLVESLSRSFHAPVSGNWLYRDADGSDVMRVLRFDIPEQGKQYRPIHFDGIGWRVGDPQNRLLPLYRLPEIGGKDEGGRMKDEKVNTSDPASGNSASSFSLHPSSFPTVFVTEGEKCVDAAWTIGLCGTTSAHGSASAERTDWSPLAGRTVVILPDNDPAGERYAKDVSRLLLQQSPQPTVKIVTLPDLRAKGDLFDWLEARDCVEPETLRKQIEALADAAKPLDPSELIGGAELVPLSSVQGRDVHWLWPQRIARGKITLLVGDPGVGKSFLTLDLAARVSTGSAFPDGSTQAGRGHVILISAEDDLHDTVHPRLTRMGADLSGITWLQSVRLMTAEGQALTRAFTLEDMPALRDALRRTQGVSLVVIDPVSAYLGDKCDGNNNAQVRGLLSQLSVLASEFDCAMVLVTHLNKSKETGGRSRAMYRAMGSLAFVAAARCAMLACKDPKDPARRLLLPMKNNIGNDRDGLAWRIEEGAVAWEPEPVDLSSDDAMSLASSSKGSNADEPLTTVIVTVTDWLRQRLTSAPVPAAEIKRDAMAQGYSISTLERARLALNIKTSKSSGSFNSPWVWSLPDAVPELLKAAVANPR